MDLFRGKRLCLQWLHGSYANLQLFYDVYLNTKLYTAGLSIAVTIVMYKNDLWMSKNEYEKMNIKNLLDSEFVDFFVGGNQIQYFLLILLHVSSKR